MSDLFLIAHKVRGEPAFDVAIQLEQLDEDGDLIWIIPTSGHRAYPYWTQGLNGVFRGDCRISVLEEFEYGHIPAPPLDHPDHYTTRAAPSLISSLSSILPKPAPIRRRV